MNLRSRPRSEPSSLSNVYVIDTDVLLDYLYDDPRAISYLENLSGVMLISAITVTELFLGVLEGPERQALDKFLSVFEIVDIDKDIATLAGLYRRDYTRKYQTTVVDALIAATAKHKNATLVTLDCKRYPMFRKVVEPYGDNA